MNKNKNINLSGLTKKYNGILIETQEELMEILSNKNASLLAIYPKKNNPPVDEIPSWFVKFSRELENTFNKIFDKLDKIEARLDKVEQRLDKVEQRLDKVEQRLDRLEKRVDHLEKRIDNLVLKNNLKE